MGAMLAAPWGAEATLMRAARSIERGLALDDTPPTHASTLDN